MCAHYLFAPDFCNMASGWEKSIVEKNVKDSRRRIWLDVQNCMFHTFEELNALFGQRCRALWSELVHPQACSRRRHACQAIIYTLSMML